MVYSWNLLHDLHERVIDDDGGWLGNLLRQVVLNLYVTTESNYLVADGVLESKHDRNGNNHDAKSDGHTNGGNADSRSTDLAALTF